MPTHIHTVPAGCRGGHMRPMFLMAGLLAILFAPAAYANAMTPLMNAGFFHLLLGNIVLGIIEGTIIKRVFRLPEKAPLTSIWQLLKPGPIALMIMANYCSAWLGFIIAAFLGDLLGLDISNYQFMRWVLVGGLYLATLLLEWPFVALCLRRQERWFVKSVKASLLVQTLTYSVLCLYYGSVTDRAFFKNVVVVPALEISMPKDLAVLYRAEWDNTPHSYTFATGIDSATPDPNLRPYWDKAVEGVQSGPLERFPVITVGPPAGTPGDWTFEMGHWQWGGIEASSKSAEVYFAVNVESPIALWRVQQATYVPTDKVVFQFGGRQVCLLDPATKKIALVAHGTEPVLATLSPPQPPATP